MKRKKVMLLSLLMVGSLMTSMSVYAEEGEVNPVIPEEEIIKNDETGIPDKALYDLVLKMGDGNNDGILTKEEAKSISSIWTSNDSSEEISSLKGIGFCTNLNDLYISNKNQITDLSPLKGLNLDSLVIYDNDGQISDLSPLSEMNTLTSLGMSSKQISDISALAGLTNLTGLYLINCQISDISALAGLTNLQALQLAGNKISDISILGNLTNLNTLWLQSNNIAKLPDLHKLTKLSTSSMGGADEETIIATLYTSFVGNQIKLSDAKANLPEHLVNDVEWMGYQNFIADAVVPDTKTQLNNKITEVENEKLDETKYTKESWNAFVTALTKAKTVLSDPSSPEEAYKSALNELTAARNNLVEKKVQVNPVKTDNSSDADKKVTETKHAVPRTGDSNNIWLMLIMLLGSAGTVIITGRRRKL